MRPNPIIPELVQIHFPFAPQHLHIITLTISFVWQSSPTIPEQFVKYNHDQVLDPHESHARSEQNQ